jgi:alkanesulfonate monooxygenase SsuD/methylene tetrahydromethanopterin reductase-like flavin-dependent oxidoreductase (luciferase family)
MLAAISQRTAHLRLGTQVLLAPLHHPLRLAEDLAVVDHLSGGRISLGLAPGYRPKEFDILGVPKKERGSRTSETIELLRLAWSGRRFEFRGRHFCFEDVIVTPRPAQESVPIWVGGSSHAAAHRAARFGCHFMSDEGTDPAVVEAYLEAREVHGFERQLARVSTNRVIYVCEDPEEGWNDVRESFLYVYNGYRRWYAEAGDSAGMGPALDDPDLLPRDLHLVGTPQMVIEEIARQRQHTLFDSLAFWAHPPGLEVAKSTRSIELFARHVAPAFRDDPARV